MPKKILFLIVISLFVASCSTHKHIPQQTTKQADRKQNSGVKIIEQEAEKPSIKQDTIVHINRAQELEPTIKNKLEKEYLKYKGVPYKYGGTSAKGFDCSGFVQLTYKKTFNIELPRSTRQMLKEGVEVSKNKLKIGDLVFFKPNNTYRHVGIYMGENLFIHVSTKRGVIKSNLKMTYWLKHYLTSRRILKPNEGS